jgi:hypothetical protein
MEIFLGAVKMKEAARNWQGKTDNGDCIREVWHIGKPNQRGEIR